MLSEFQLDQLHQNDGEKDARTGRGEQDRDKAKADDDELGLVCLDKFLDCRIRLRRKAQGYSKHLLGNLTRKSTIKTLRRVL